MCSFSTNAEHMVSIQKVLAIIVTVVLLVLIFTCHVSHDDKITERYPNIPILKMFAVKLRK